MAGKPKRRRLVGPLSILAVVISLGGAGCRGVYEESGEARVLPRDVGLFDAAGNAYTELLPAARAALSLHPDAERLIFFVHGAGPYPDKAIDGGELDAIAMTYDAAVLMVSWPAWKGSWAEVARQSAVASGVLIAPYWAEVARLRQQPEWSGKDINLIVHSLGAEVMRGVASAPHATVFDLLLLAASETDLAEHASWLSKLTLSERTAVLSNPNDGVLALLPAQTHRGRPSLGRGLILPSGQWAVLAPGVTYITLKRQTLSHAVYAGRQPRGVAALLLPLMREGQIDAICNAGAGVTQVIEQAGNSFDKARCLLPKQAD